jgi:hypothetical protein
MRRVRGIRTFGFTVAVILFPGSARPSEGGMEDCPMHAEHQASAKRQNQSEREVEGMGFSQERTTHHFVLASDGGRIQVTANAVDDHATIEQVRSHLGHIARAFKAGDFAIPMLVHDQNPPGAPAMRRLKSEISYAYEAQPGGASVVIRTRNPEAVAAVHEFLRFQIREHQTGDPVL